MLKKGKNEWVWKGRVEEMGSEGSLVFPMLVCTGEMCMYLCWKRGKTWGLETSHGKETGEGSKVTRKKGMRGQGRRTGWGEGKGGDGRECCRNEGIKTIVPST